MYAALGELLYGVICREQSIQPAIGQLAGRQRQSSSMVQLAGNSKSSLLWGNLPASNVRAGLRRNLSGTVNPAFWGGDLPGSSVQAVLWGNLAVTVNPACSRGIYREATLQLPYDAIHREQ